jgi:hypothetical protein
METDFHPLSFQSLSPNQSDHSIMNRLCTVDGLEKIGITIGIQIEIHCQEKNA